jgi:DnaJ family protein B protein 13
MSEKNNIVLKGLGHEQAGIANSDLIFQIKQVADPVWKRNGNDLIYSADISLLDAL